MMCPVGCAIYSDIGDSRRGRSFTIMAQDFATRMNLGWWGKMMPPSRSIAMRPRPPSRMALNADGLSETKGF